ncbi:hypothetical protein JCM8547_008556 [Rhodosporidiobolus lusitaniae]
MGNNASTQAGGSGRSSRHPSPKSRNVPLPSTSSSAPSTSSSDRPRRKKSIDMDVVPRSSLRLGSGARRKNSDRPPVVDEEADPDPPEGPGGSLRGALQGKAEHVVYGPRREDDDAHAVLLNPAPSLPAVPAAGTVKPVAMAIPGAGGPGGGGPARTPAGGLVGGRDGSLTNAGMGAIGASAMPMDPDDTTHPGFSTAPRLTSAVLMSTDKMPVLNSPMKEELPTDSPFRPQTPGTPGAGADGSQTPTQEQPGTTVTAYPSHPNRLPSEDLAAAQLPSVRSFQAPTTSLASAASAIFSPTSAGAGQPGVSSLTASAPIPTPTVPTAQLLPPHTSSPSPPSTAPSDTVTAPPVPTTGLPLSADHIPSGTSVIASPCTSRGTTPTAPSPAVLLPPAVFNAPVAAIPIPLLSVPSPQVAEDLLKAAVDLGAGEEGVPTLIKWKDEDGQVKASEGRPAKGPREVFVTGTFAKGWKTKIELRKTDASDFAALISLPPGPHRLKFIVDNEWKASKHLPVATDADGNLINYLQINAAASSKIPPAAWSAAAAASSAASAAGGSGTVTPAHVVVTPTSAPVSASYTAAPSMPVSPTSSGGRGGQGAAAAGGGGMHFPAGGNGFQNFAGLSWPFNGGVGVGDEDDPSSSGGNGGADPWGEDDASWSQEIPAELVAWGEWETVRDQIEADFYARYPDGPSESVPYPELPPPPPSAGYPPPSLPAQLEKGPLNHAAYVTQGSGDDNSILPKPDHSVINHLAASPIKGGFLSVGVTTRYRRKFVTIVYYKALSSR